MRKQYTYNNDNRKNEQLDKKLVMLWIICI